MSDRAWMYTGHTGQNKWSAEWFTKTKGFVQAAFANGQKKTWCPCFRCGNWEPTDLEDEGGTVYQRGATRLPSVPVTREQRWLIFPDGERYVSAFNIFV